MKSERTLHDDSRSADFDGANRVWKALADCSRRRILDLLRERPMTTSELDEEFPFTRFAVMKHLRVLEDAGLVTVRRRGRERFNQLNPVPILAILRRWMRPFEVVHSDRLLQLKAAVETKEEDR